MRNVPIPPEKLQDPLAFTLHPNLSRDPCRTPMPWDASPYGGFSKTEPWLPLGADRKTRNVEAQKRDRGSLLHLYRRLLALRRRTPALSRGAQRPLEAPETVFAYERRHGRQRVVVALNFADEPVQLSLGRGAVAGGLHTRAGARRPRTLARIALGPCEGVALVCA
jgi:glycosidase